MKKSMGLIVSLLVTVITVPHTSSASQPGGCFSSLVGESSIHGLLERFEAQGENPNPMKNDWGTPIENAPTTFREQIDYILDKARALHQHNLKDGEEDRIYLPVSLSKKTEKESLRLSIGAESSGTYRDPYGSRLPSIAYHGFNFAISIPHNYFRNSGYFDVQELVTALWERAVKGANNRLARLSFDYSRVYADEVVFVFDIELRSNVQSAAYETDIQTLKTFFHSLFHGHQVPFSVAP